ncbi:D-alanyl-D-alanine carboxypeptidase/D-alanyl-D-alanine-endopeptidase [Mizugakiibacter sediminis]|uniref:D-alanyl-D-alanine carboxypeptidase n=1 Tax=Mizugakiibacter sediminis TaxID=1475481 RepID=A0A0K8QM42_9GAMM|nr:D-alanyl-D-alanine carboxypeptidase/D-alanyl-D-alanine-endopeptidase [Mizugakiibacter sediminis]GAP65776.1 D-alanyl-D-alanine carboxypeptidase/D-alanyl-D-alanine-endopeptidase [Mizugakiibacter sediminis]
MTSNRLPGLLAALALAACSVAPPRASAPPPVAVVAPKSPAALAARIDAYLAQPRFAAAAWGIHVVALDSGRTLYAHDADKLAVPASNAKLYTAALALDALGANYRIATSLYATRAPGPHGVLRGDLLLVGRGDPGFGAADGPTADWAERFTAAVVARGIVRVRGDLVADATFYQGPEFGSGWEAGDLQSGFAAPVSALGVADNAVQVTVTRDGARCCAVTVTPAEAGVAVVNRTSASSGAALGLYRAPGTAALYALGSLPAGVDARSYTLSAPDPAMLAGNLLRTALARRGVRIDGRVRALRWPQADPALASPDLQTLAELASPPLSELVRRALKDSDNLYAQHLLLQVGVQAARRGVCADRARPPDTSEGWGLCALRALLARIGIAPGAATFEEGSGLSRKDLVTPRATTTLLAWVRTQPFAQTYLDALPVAGVDGTLDHRFAGTPADGRLRAKTGTLAHSYALSGYVTDAAGEPLAFALMLDRYLRPTDAQGASAAPAPGADLDAIAALLAGYAGATTQP